MTKATFTYMLPQPCCGHYPISVTTEFEPRNFHRGDHTETDIICTSLQIEPAVHISEEHFHLILWEAYDRYSFPSRYRN